MSISLEMLFKKIEQLSPEDQKLVQDFVDSRKQVIYPEINETPEERLAMLNKAFQEIRQSLSDDDLEEIVTGMSPNTSS